MNNDTASTVEMNKERPWLFKPGLFGTDGIRGIYGQGALTEMGLKAIGWGIGTLAYDNFNHSNNSVKDCINEGPTHRHPEIPTSPLLEKWLKTIPPAMLPTMLSSGPLPAHFPSPWVPIICDTRASCWFMAQHLIRGLQDAGVRGVFLGVMPTAALGVIIPAFHANGGIMISASHNPAQYNGVKVFSDNGRKVADGEIHVLTQAMCQAHQHYTQGSMASISPPHNQGWQDYSMTVMAQAKNLYTDFLCHIAGDLTGLEVVLDGANGALSLLAPGVFQRCGAKVMQTIGCTSTGHNINQQCGSLHPEALGQAMVKTQTSSKTIIGFAFDGDGDRIVAADVTGGIHDGDQILGCLAHYCTLEITLDDATPQTNQNAAPSDGSLDNSLDSPPLAAWADLAISPSSGVVGTDFSNTALAHFLQQHNKSFVRCEPGDHAVLRTLDECRWQLGGEPSGHILLPHILPTGDGLLTALLLARLTLLLGCNPFPLFQSTPSLCINVPVNDGGILRDIVLQSQLKQHHNHLDALGGRLFVRASGTESVIRVLLEGPDQDTLSTLADSITKVIAKADSDVGVDAIVNSLEYEMKV